LLFTVPLDKQESIMRLGLVDVIGHITREEAGVVLVTPDGEGIALKAQAFDR
jgi:thiamine-monophosphate kinase